MGCRGGGRGGSCILAVGEESEPALLVSRRAQLQPRGPARPLAARPGLLGWAQARPRAGGGASPPPPAPFPPWRPGAGCSTGAGRLGFPRPPPPGEGRAWGGGSPPPPPPRPPGPDRPLSRPTRAPWQPIFLVNSAPAAPGGLARDCKLPEGKVREGWIQTPTWNPSRPFPPYPVQYPSPRAAGSSRFPSPPCTPSPSHKFSLWGLLLQSLLQHRVPGWALGTHRGRSPTVCGSHEDPG